MLQLKQRRNTLVWAVSALLVRSGLRSQLNTDDCFDIGDYSPARKSALVLCQVSYTLGVGLRKKVPLGG